MHAKKQVTLNINHFIFRNVLKFELLVSKYSKIHITFAHIAPSIRYTYNGIQGRDMEGTP